MAVHSAPVPTLAAIDMGRPQLRRAPESKASQVKPRTPPRDGVIGITKCAALGYASSGRKPEGSPAAREPSESRKKGG